MVIPATVKLPSSILFLCGKNSIRSPMAQMLARALLPKSIFIQSAGIEAGSRDYFVDSVLEEVGLDLGDRQPRIYNHVEDDSFDVIVALTDKAHQKAIEMTKTVSSEVIFWPMNDPTLAKGRRDQVLMAYRDVRNAIEKRIKEHFMS